MNINTVKEAIKMHEELKNVQERLKMLRDETKENLVASTTTHNCHFNFYIPTSYMVKMYERDERALLRWFKTHRVEL